MKLYIQRQFSLSFCVRPCAYVLHTDQKDQHKILVVLIMKVTYLEDSMVEISIYHYLSISLPPCCSERRHHVACETENSSNKDIIAQHCNHFTIHNYWMFCIPCPNCSHIIILSGNKYGTPCMLSITSCKIRFKNQFYPYIYFINNCTQMPIFRTNMDERKLFILNLSLCLNSLFLV